MNIAVCEGSTAIILCTYTGASTIPTWYINETNYSWLSIQKLYVLEWLYNGARITIRNVSIQINSTKYQCGFPQEDSIRSAVGILYVCKYKTISSTIKLNTLLKIRCAYTLGVVYDIRKGCNSCN